MATYTNGLRFRLINRMQYKCERLFSKWSTTTYNWTMLPANISNDSLSPAISERNRSPDPIVFLSPNQCWRSFCEQALNLTQETCEIRGKNMKTYCIRSEVSLGTFWWHGRGYKTLKQTETTQPIGQSFNLHLLHRLLRGRKCWSGKIQHGASNEGRHDSRPIEVGRSSSRRHVFGHECWMCQGKPLHTHFWRPIIFREKNQEDAQQ